MAEGVREQVEEHALDLLGRDRRGRLAVGVRDEVDVPRGRLGLEQAQRRVDEPGDRQLLQLERERARVDPGELEQVVDEQRQRPHLLAQGRQVVARLGEAVLDRLDHRLHRRERRAQVVARPGDELAARVEELLDARRPSR